MFLVQCQAIYKIIHYLIKQNLHYPYCQNIFFSLTLSLNVPYEITVEEFQWPSADRLSKFKARSGNVTQQLRTNQPSCYQTIYLK